MNAKPAIVILLLLCLALGGGLIFQLKRAGELKQSNDASLLSLSNDLVQARGQVTDLEKARAKLETNFAIASTQAKTYSNRLAETSQTLQQVKDQASAAAQKAHAALAKSEAQNSSYENRIASYTKQMTQLSHSQEQLQQQIDVTKKRLAASEGDRKFLLKELKRLQAEKAKLERRFNSLAALREQIRKIKDEISITKRIEWIRQGIFGSSERKGAELLQKGLTQAPANTNYSLNVELRNNGSAKILSNTNPPPATQASPK